MSEATVFALIGAYLAGSIPSSYWIGRVFYGIRLDQEGSRNLGATNALRVMGKPAGIASLILDMAKGVVAVFLARYLLPESPDWHLAAGFVAILGHSFSVFVRFKGGKGVATSAGVFLALAPKSLGASLLLFALIVGLTRYVSLGSILAALSLPGLIWHFQPGQNRLLGFSIVIALFVVYRHRSNMSRLLKGEENKLGKKSERKS